MPIALTKLHRTPKILGLMSHEKDILTAQVLVVDDEVDHADVMAEALRRVGHVCTILHGRETAEDELQHGSFDLIITDLVMDREEDGFAVLEAARKYQPDAETIVVTAHGDVPTATKALKQGAFDFLEKPLDLEVFRSRCDNAIKTVVQRAQISELRERLDEEDGFEGIIGSAVAVRQVIQLLRQIAPSHIPTLITGESGTGKELAALAIHNNSKRAQSRFVPLNCAGLSDSILEDELFGHVKGAYTGAERDRQGRFEYAHGGTLFLDEIGDMPLRMQAKLMRVLESGEVIRLGANEPKHVDVRLISATNRDIKAMAEEKKFRDDLYFRIAGVELHMPALRERREDIPLLVRHYLRKYAEQVDRPVPQVAEDAQRALMRYDWPGNVRQLMNVVQNMVVIADGDILEPRHLPPVIVDSAGEGDSGAARIPAGLSLNQVEKLTIRNALHLHQGNREATAKSLGIGERTLYRKLKEYGLK